MNAWLAKKRHQRARRALERQLEYQEQEARRNADHADEMMRDMFLRSQLVRQRLNAVRRVDENASLLEVGSGSHGLVFGFANTFGVGVDPLAVEYKRLFPTWQGKAATVAANGENLPFANASFDVVLSDNVIDHAEDPIGILYELMRVLRKGGLLFFTVNIHHRFYDLASKAYGVWGAVGTKVELSAFADHTVHLTERKLDTVFARLPLEIVERKTNVADRKAALAAARTTKADDLLKKAFFKNASFELIGVRR